MSFNVSISGRTKAAMTSPHKFKLEAEILDRVENLVAHLREDGHEITLAHYGSDYLQADLVAGTREERDTSPVVEEPPAAERGTDLVVGEGVTGVVPIRGSGQGPQPADPSAPVGEQEGTVTP